MNNRGDTIIEVLIVLAILSFAFAISMSTANKGLQESRSAEEHSRGLGVENAQMELLRLAVSKKIDLPNGTFCFDPADKNLKPVEGFPPTYNATSPINSTAGFPPACVTDGMYISSITDDGDGNYTVRVRWAGLGTENTQQELMTYRTHELSVDESFNTNIGGAPTEAQVRVNAIPLKPGTILVDRTPSCTSNATGVRGGSDITLTDHDTLAIKTGTTSSLSSSVTFSNIDDYHTYSATMTSIPAGWKACKNTTAATPPVTTSQKQAIPNNSASTTFTELKIYPQCTKVTIRDPDVAVYGPWYNVGNQPIYHTGHTVPVYSAPYWHQGARRGDLDFYANSGYNGTYQNYPLPGAIGPEVGSPHTHAAVPSGSGVKYFGGYIASNHHSGKGFYAVWDAWWGSDFLYNADHSGHITGYTPDDWRRDFIRWDPAYHDEYPCPS